MAVLAILVSLNPTQSLGKDLSRSKPFWGKCKGLTPSQLTPFPYLLPSLCILVTCCPCRQDAHCTTHHTVSVGSFFHSAFFPTNAAGAFLAFWPGPPLAEQGLNRASIRALHRIFFCEKREGRVQMGTLADA